MPDGYSNPDRIPPQNIEAEQSVLGAILLDNESLTDVLEILTDSDFYRESHRKIFRGVMALYEKGGGIDTVTLTDWLRGRGEIESVGGASYIASLLHDIPTAANIAYHARIVREKAVLRQLIHSVTDIAGRGYEGAMELPDLLDYAEKKIFEISERKVRPSFIGMREIVKDSFEMIDRLYERKERITGVPSGFTDLDQLTAGFQAGDLIIVAGRPAMGKTAFCLNIAQHLGIQQRLPVAVFSLEMAARQLVIRMLCSEARVDAHKLRSGFLADSDFPRLANAAGRLSEAPIYIDDTSSPTVLEIRAKARRLKADHGLSLVVVDYLQLVRGRAGVENRVQEISEISRGLKALAKELDVPVIALSQLNRAVEGRNDRRPLMADLRESGAIEQDADLIVFIYREEMYRPDNEDAKGKAEIIVGKQRNGPTGTVELAFLNNYTRFENLSTHRAEEPAFAA